MDIFIRIQRNLYLRGAVLVSYDTEVADIVDNTLQARGVYSRTTTKHLHLAASLLGLSFVPSKKLGQFYWKEMGAKELKPSRTLSNSASEKLISLMKEGNTLHESLYLLSEDKIKLGDRELIERALKGVDVEDLRRSVQVKRLIF